MQSTQYENNKSTYPAPIIVEIQLSVSSTNRKLGLSPRIVPALLLRNHSYCPQPPLHEQRPFCDREVRLS